MQSVSKPPEREREKKREKERERERGDNGAVYYTSFIKTFSYWDFNINTKLSV